MPAKRNGKSPNGNGHGHAPNGQPKFNGKTAAIVKRAQPHGGALNAGGTPGNKGGLGRTPEFLRFKSRALYEQWCDWAAKIFHDAETTDELRMQIGQTAGRYGFVQSNMVSGDGVRARLTRQLEILGEIMPKQEADRIAAAIEPVWQER